MTRKDLLKSGYQVRAKNTGAEYPNFAPSLGTGWELVLSAPGQPDRGFTSAGMAWAFADRLASQIPARSQVSS